VVQVVVVGLVAGCAESAPPPKAAVKESPRQARVKIEPALAAGHSTAMTYEEALAVPEDLSGLAGERELSDLELSAPMKSAPFLADCKAPDAMSVTVKVAVKGGKAIGVSVFTRPDDAAVARCIDRAVRALRWPENRRRDSLVTTY
jgi:hypothetical protein